MRIPRAMQPFGNLMKKIYFNHLLNIKTVESKQTKNGQVGKYKDSIYQWVITSQEPEDKVREHCQTLMKSENEHPNGNFGGSCNFPFGLNSYFKFTNNNDGTFTYTVCVPYCD